MQDVPAYRSSAMLPSFAQNLPVPSFPENGASSVSSALRVFDASMPCTSADENVTSAEGLVSTESAEGFFPADNAEIV